MQRYCWFNHCLDSILRISLARLRPQLGMMDPYEDEAPESRRRHLDRVIGKLRWPRGGEQSRFKVGRRLHRTPISIGSRRWRDQGL
jgi:hypothetical protein